MLPAVLIGIAGILFMLGIISMQIASFRDNGWFFSAALTLIFIACTGISILLVVAALSGVTASL